MCCVQNYSTVEYLEGHIFAGRLPEIDKTILVKMSKCHMCSKDILILLSRKILKVIQP